MNSILLILVTYGLTAVFIESQLFSWFRWVLRRVGLGKLARCYRCLGFWSGCAIAFWHTLHPDSLLLFPFAASGGCYLISRFIPKRTRMSDIKVLESEPDRQT